MDRDNFKVGRFRGYEIKGCRGLNQVKCAEKCRFVLIVALQRWFVKRRLKALKYDKIYNR